MLAHLKTLSLHPSLVSHVLTVHGLEDCMPFLKFSLCPWWKIMVWIQALNPLLSMYSVHTAKIICFFLGLQNIALSPIKAFQSLQALSTTSLLSCNMHEDCTHFLFKAICLLSWTLLLPQYFNNNSPLSEGIRLLFLCIWSLLLVALIPV